VQLVSTTFSLCLTRLYNWLYIIMQHLFFLAASSDTWTKWAKSCVVCVDSSCSCAL